MFFSGRGEVFFLKGNFIDFSNEGIVNKISCILEFLNVAHVMLKTFHFLLSFSLTGTEYNLN